METIQILTEAFRNLKQIMNEKDELPKEMKNYQMRTDRAIVDSATEMLQLRKLIFEKGEAVDYTKEFD